MPSAEHSDAAATTTTVPPPTNADLTAAGVRKVTATINYLHPSAVDPYVYMHNDHPREDPQSTAATQAASVPIADLRGTTASQRTAWGLDVDRAGFELVAGFGSDPTAADWAARAWEDDHWLTTTYYADVDALLRRVVPRVRQTAVFDHTVRKRLVRADDGRDVFDGDDDNDPLNRRPVARAHCDQTRWAGENRIRKHLGEDTLAAVRRGELRVRLINVWRVLRGEAWDFPLAYADSRTTEERDWAVTKMRYKDWTGETYAIYANDKHRWYYYSGLDSSSAVLLKCFDTDNDTRTPHTGFLDPTSPAGVDPRWSVEVRVLVVSDKESSSS
ncbi:hypothetical protein DFJ73DRAFT_878017 [Zopfochytrium polystomum]|nr:hypothetical protein DFJ73DRAFT_878017 [Zopfochytrium polystomum]